MKMKPFTCYLCRGNYVITEKALVIAHYGTKDINFVICPNCAQQLLDDKRTENLLFSGVNVKWD